VVTPDWRGVSLSDSYTILSFRTWSRIQATGSGFAPSAGMTNRWSVGCKAITGTLHQFS